MIAAAKWDNCSGFLFLFKYGKENALNYNYHKSLVNKAIQKKCPKILHVGIFFVLLYYRKTKVNE